MIISSTFQQRNKSFFCVCFFLQLEDISYYKSNQLFAALWFSVSLSLYANLLPAKMNGFL